ncbi:MAG: endonuclease V [Thermomonas sp.]|nr:endonuclease V [Thermomonas sp.]
MWRHRCIASAANGTRAQLVVRATSSATAAHGGRIDVGFEEGGAITRAAAVLLDATHLEVIASEVARLPTRMPYIPGLLSFRELPALLAALELLPQTPDLVFVDGHGIAHPRRLGIAAHFGVATGLPSIGVAKKILVGESRTNLHDMRGAFTPLRHGAEQIGWILRSKPGCLPLIISPGHRVAMASAPTAMWSTTASPGNHLPPRAGAARLADTAGCALPRPPSVVLPRTPCHA